MRTARLAEEIAAFLAARNKSSLCPCRIKLVNWRECCVFFFFFGSVTHESENSRRLWLFLGSLREFWRKSRENSENCWKHVPESPNPTHSRIWGTGKGKPAGNLGSTLPGPCPHLPCGVFFEIDSSSLLEFLPTKIRSKNVETFFVREIRNSSQRFRASFALQRCHPKNKKGNVSAFFKIGDRELRTHHPHKDLSHWVVFLRGVVCELSEPKKKAKYALPQF